MDKILTRVECFKRYFNTCNKNTEDILILYLTEFEANIDSIGQNNLNDAFLFSYLDSVRPVSSKKSHI